MRVNNLSRSALRRENGLLNQSEASELLGVTRFYLSQKIGEGSVPPPARAFLDFKVRFYSRADVENIRKMFGIK